MFSGRQHETSFDKIKLNISDFLSSLESFVTTESALFADSIFVRDYLFELFHTASIYLRFNITCNSCRVLILAAILHQSNNIS